MTHKYLSSILLIFSLHFSFAQTHQPRFETIDVQHYAFEIHLNDSTNRIECKTTVTIKFLKSAENVVFDLIKVNTENRGMSITSVKTNNSALKFIHEKDELKVELPQMVKNGDISNFEIQYSGVPADGLVISENIYGKRTFFGDNWPNRAKHWLPTVDHPSDKATLEFLVYAPKHYEVVSNGVLVKKKQLANNVEFTHWKENVPLATKLMVIGLADFAIGNKTNYKDIPVSSWVFEQNKEQGFKNYKYSTKALEYFSELIGPYSYKKLAHVQSKTRYGGMENASCIFYNEKTAISKQSQERLFAHEVAHQWFGNSVTEQNWHHIWLSEGFATYLTHVYNQHFYGEEEFKKGLLRDREQVIRYSKRNLKPIIDTTVTEYIKLLNTNSYQKASWFLHMLRMDLGDELFFKGLQKYYADFQNSTALTIDFLSIMSEVSNKNLDAFFQQWLWQPGHPVLRLNWTQKDNGLIIQAIQKQKEFLFDFPLEFKVLYADGSSERFAFTIKESEAEYSINTTKEIKDLVFDPDVKLLFDFDRKMQY
jgi:aminopeptidase N